MILPIPFLVGLGVLVGAEQIAEVLPGQGSVASLLTWSLLLPVPAIIARLADASLRRSLLAGRRPGVGLRLALRLLPATVPCIYFLLLVRGTLLDLAERWCGGYETLRLSLLLAPLLLLDLSRLGAESGLWARLERAGLAVGGPVRGARAAMFVFLSIPLICFGLALDLLAQHRHLQLFFQATSVGAMLGLFGFLLCLAVLVPILFRLLMGTTTRLPPQHAEDLRATARALGFPPRHVLAMRTGHRMINAAMVGPLPWPRYLVLTDGLLAVLDRLALRGVVAHEVAHARAGHPGYLTLAFVVIPLLLVHPFEVAGGSELQAGTLVLVVGAALAAALLALRVVAHRFEHEADLASAAALGGAAPCVQALQRVGELTQQNVHRASLRHPSEASRVHLLLRWQADPDFRRRFDARGVLLRRVLLAVALAALGLSGWAWSVTWPAERTVVAFYGGDIGGARERLAAIGTDVPAGMWEWWQLFREEVEAAATIAPEGGPWHELRPELAGQGWRRGIEVLRQQGPEAARPWFALATEDTGGSPLRRVVYLWCNAIRRGETERAERLRAHLAGMELPPELDFVRQS